MSTIKAAVAERLEREADRIWPQATPVPPWRLDTISARARAQEAADLRAEAKALREGTS